MRRTCLLVAAATLGAATFSFSRDARALGPIDLEIAAKGGYGTNPFGGNINPLGAGLGGRAGVAFFGFYGGAALLYYFGGSQSGVSEHSLMYGLEAGYNWKIAILTIRPQLGVGNYSLDVGNTSGNNIYLEPGVTGLISLGTFFVGADANLLVLPSIQQPDGNKGTDTAFTVHGQVGVKF
jgi:hypothetical protein